METNQSFGENIKWQGWMNISEQLLAQMVALIVAASTFLSAIIGVLLYRYNKKQIEAHTESEISEASKSITDATLLLLNPLKDQIANLQTSLAQAKDELAATKEELVILKQDYQEAIAGIHILIDQLEEHNIKPKWVPKKKGS